MSLFSSLTLVGLILDRLLPDLSEMSHTRVNYVLVFKFIEKKGSETIGHGTPEMTTTCPFKFLLNSISGMFLWILFSANNPEEICMV